MGLNVTSVRAHMTCKHELLLQDEYRQEAGSVVEVDYYNATSLLRLTDEQLIQRTLHTYLAACQPAYGLCQVRDASVLRYGLICIRNASQAIFMMNNNNNNNDDDNTNNDNNRKAAASLLVSSELLASWV